MKIYFIGIQIFYLKRQVSFSSLFVLLAREDKYSFIEFSLQQTSILQLSDVKTLILCLENPQHILQEVDCRERQDISKRLLLESMQQNNLLSTSMYISSCQFQVISITLIGRQRLHKLQICTNPQKSSKALQIIKILILLSNLKLLISDLNYVNNCSVLQLLSEFLQKSIDLIMKIFLLFFSYIQITEALPLQLPIQMISFNSKSWFILFLE
ncbi:hypothetical protein TTHERM_000773529 (macronuclear) [Tetrahymena thermophila SB210]|uniref:Uncharacterized protein n=1 Tax=Tetrahymena thermophila (strain SB210) TaxID=312017 RepID=W7X7N3_TETTS|nr:hypothetical protein TTHERM_000773529 [Tetrahymena thermophila SB210]EWS72423.1 hypothetical protein TTHERM_000773529 [Tetrahymena thermophila SB210]|eukprot:XP_012655050.1 hypothetical protein TTHERM_000773529 [Tetrahymena thermophila SB210]